MAKEQCSYTVYNTCTSKIYFILMCVCGHDFVCWLVCIKLVDINSCFGYYIDSGVTSDALKAFCKREDGLAVFSVKEVLFSPTFEEDREACTLYEQTIYVPSDTCMNFV